MVDLWGEIGSTAGRIYDLLAKAKKSVDLADVKK